jgi:hypothetical protein
MICVTQKYGVIRRERPEVKYEYVTDDKPSGLKIAP